MIKKIVKRDGRIVPFDKEKIVFAILQAAVAVGGRDRMVAESVAGDVVKMLEERQYKDSYSTVEEVQDIVEKCLIEHGHAKTAKAYIVYRYEHALKRAGRASLTYSSDNVPYKKLWQILSWAIDHQCVTLGQLYQIINQARFKDLVNDCEDFYNAEVNSAFLKIKERLDELKIIIVSGPSASGKTTTTLKIKEKLEELGYHLITLNVDNYFFDLDLHPRDSHGDYDFETPQALDLDLVNQHLKKLLQGKTIKVPYYDFKKGKRKGFKEKLCLGKKDLVLIDSLHGMFEQMTQGIPEELKFRLYIETLLQLKDNNLNYVRWSDVRMLRRMVRDMQFRNYIPLQTIKHWHHVRRSELRYIVSKLKKAQAIVNSALAYELPLMKNRLQQHFPGFIKTLSGDTNMQDAYERAVRVYNLFKQTPTCADEDIVPANSLLREFIGGSVYTY